VNNGGFSQYLSNKGPRRARAALEARLAALDKRFYAEAQDLPTLAARHGGL
jgi:hypothetical protein